MQSLQYRESKVKTLSLDKLSSVSIKSVLRTLLSVFLAGLWLVVLFTTENGVFLQKAIIGTLVVFALMALGYYINKKSA